MWFHLRLVPLRTGTEIPSVSWPAREEGHLSVQHSSHFRYTSPLDASIHFRQGTFYIRQEDMQSTIRVNGVQLPSRTDQPLNQSDIVELNRPSTGAYCADLSFRVDLSCSSSSAPIFPGPYSLVPSRARPTYAWFDDFDRALDDQARHYGSSRPCPPLQTAAFALGECIITTSNLIPRPAEAPYPLTRSSPPCPPTNICSTSSSPPDPLQPPGSTSVSTSVLPITDSVPAVLSASSTSTPPSQNSPTSSPLPPSRALPASVSTSPFLPSSSPAVTPVSSSPSSIAPSPSHSHPDDGPVSTPYSDILATLRSGQSSTTATVCSTETHALSSSCQPCLHESVPASACRSDAPLPSSAPSSIISQSASPSESVMRPMSTFSPDPFLPTTTMFITPSIPSTTSPSGSTASVDLALSRVRQAWIALRHDAFTAASALDSGLRSHYEDGVPDGLHSSAIGDTRLGSANLSLLRVGAALRACLAARLCSSLASVGLSAPAIISPGSLHSRQAEALFYGRAHPILRKCRRSLFRSKQGCIRSGRGRLHHPPPVPNSMYPCGPRPYIFSSS
ncbi:hypothetical protein A4X13_0g8092 [Tilletia indica]|uniref:Uncharacterized protein n=1 Tax=Tilletia indica TaxID=43049 RepID=A0A177T515_9BASI|nr:hypothetical protein A4X13_0g8092 [Tilletia indica]